MRRVIRTVLPSATQDGLIQKQNQADEKHRAGQLRVHEEWQSGRQSATLRSVLDVLRRMTGERQRCMYCLDSHGTDIEHFWPKTRYPERMFAWPNLLLCCTECGRLKGDRFPLAADGAPLLIDPTAEEPWLYLDFDPQTGNIVPRFDADSQDWSARGLRTVEILQLDQREALASGCIRTYRRLRRIVDQFLRGDILSADALLDALQDADDHGLLGWCFIGAGQALPPFCDLRAQRKDIWEACAAAIQQVGANY